MNGQISQEGIDLIKSFEQCRLSPYQDSGGVWTDGWGNTHEVVPGQDVTQEQADARLLQNLQLSVEQVNNCVTVDITQHEFDALVSFDFNCGYGSLRGSTLLRLVNEEDFEGAAQEFEKWDHVSGKVCAGLLRRRQAEEEEFKEN